MPKAWSNTDERQYEHIKESSKKRGRSTKRAKEIAARTVNKQRSQEGRTKKQRSRTSTRRKSASNGRSSSRTSSNGRSSNGRSSRNDLSSQTKEQLYARAKKLNIHGRSSMNKSQLARAIRSER